MILRSIWLRKAACRRATGRAFNTETSQSNPVDGIQPNNPACTLHAWTDGSFRVSAGMVWVIIEDEMGADNIIAQGSRSLGTRQTAFDTEITAIEDALFWFLNNRSTGFKFLVIHSDSTSAIAHASHTGAGPGQQHAVRIHKWASGLQNLRRNSCSVHIVWVKGHSSVPGNERADKLAGEAAERQGPYSAMSLAHLKLKISERFRKSKEEWHATPANNGTMEIPLPPPKKSMLNRARNPVARTAAQIRSGHWRSAVTARIPNSCGISSSSTCPC
jgi:ribonuclease HI